MVRTGLGSCRWGNCTFGKLPLGKMSLVSPIEKGNEEVKITSDVYNRPFYKLINRVVGCVHHGIFIYISNTVGFYIE